MNRTIVKSDVKSCVTFLSDVETSIDRLLETAPKSSSEDYAKLLEQLTRAANLAWALKTYPSFDPSILEQRHKKEIKVDLRNFGGGGIVKSMAIVPVFGREAYRPTGTSTVYSTTVDRLGEEFVKEFKESARGRVEPYFTVDLRAQCPAPPKSVRERVAAVVDRFDRVDIAWEAEWTAEVRVQDPLIIGVIGGVEFIIDEYDASKLERYIASEFTRKVE